MRKFIEYAPNLGDKRPVILRIEQEFHGDAADQRSDGAGANQADTLNVQLDYGTGLRIDIEFQIEVNGCARHGHVHHGAVTFAVLQRGMAGLLDAMP